MNYQAYPWGRWIKWIVLGLVALIIIGNAAGTYNGLVSAEQDMERQWSQVENVMQTRLDKLVNMVEVVKKHAELDQKIIKDITDARAVLGNPAADLNAKVDADVRLAAATRSLLAVVENYPELKSGESFRDLRVTIEGTESRVSLERMRFIEEVNEYNKMVKRFPGNIFARFMGFGPREYYKANPEALESPRINFD